MWVCMRRKALGGRKPFPRLLAGFRDFDSTDHEPWTSEGEPCVHAGHQRAPRPRAREKTRGRRKTHGNVEKYGYFTWIYKYIYIPGTALLLLEYYYRTPLQNHPRFWGKLLYVLLQTTAAGLLGSS